jgi:glutathione S-transferase
MPALRDAAHGQTVFETSIIIEYLNQYYPGRTALIPSDPDLARQTRLLDRFYDLYVSEPMQKVVADRLRPPGTGDAFGVAEAKAGLRKAYAIIEERLADRTWELGEAFSMVECSAAPALHYADLVEPLASGYPRVRAYLQRLRARPSYARVVREAEPYAQLFPKEK